MTAPSAADRAKAAEIVADWQLHFDADQTDVLERMIETRLAAERADAVEQITADVRALAEELEGESGQYVRDARPMPPASLARKYLTGRVTSLQAAAARLRAVVADTGKPDTSSEEEQA